MNFLSRCIPVALCVSFTAPGVLSQMFVKTGGNDYHGDVYFDYENSVRMSRPRAFWPGEHRQSDAGAAAFTNQAIDEADRAVEELFLRQGLR